MPNELRNELNRHRNKLNSHRNKTLFMKWLPLTTFTLLTIGGNVFLYEVGLYYTLDVIILSFMIGISGGVAIWILLATQKWANRHLGQK
jgi:hypothetical protein